MNPNNTPADQPKVRCYGYQAALTVEGTRLTSQHNPHGIATVNLDIAPNQGSQVDWSHKITLQLSDTELPVLAAVCLGYLPSAQFKRPTKGIYIERQDNKLFVSASQGAGNQFALPIPIGQTFQIGCLLLAQLKQQVALEDSDLLIAALRGAAALYKASASGR